jgi:hypothetical protein
MSHPEKQQQDETGCRIARGFLMGLDEWFGLVIAL